MYLLEFQAKEILKKYDLPIPDGYVIKNPLEFRDCAKDFIGPFMVKAQVRMGGRAKAGLIKEAQNVDEVVFYSKKLINKEYKGELIKFVLVEKKLKIKKELYIGITLDFENKCPVFIVSSLGGIDIEEIAKSQPNLLTKILIDPLNYIISEDIWIKIWKKLKIERKHLTEITRICKKILDIFFQIEGITIEINPLIITEDDEIIAADAKIIVDDESLYRQNIINKYIEKGNYSLEAIARQEIGVVYISLNKKGNIGVIAGGAGLAMATMDEIFENGLYPSAFLDLGGGISKVNMAKALQLMLKTENLGGIIINVFGGINNLAKIAKGIQMVYQNKKPKVPIVVKMRGHAQEEGWNILEKLNIPFIKYGSTKEAIKLLNQVINKEGKNGSNS